MFSDAKKMFALLPVLQNIFFSYCKKIFSWHEIFFLAVGESFLWQEKNVFFSKKTFFWHQE